MIVSLTYRRPSVAATSSPRWRSTFARRTFVGLGLALLVAGRAEAQESGIEVGAKAPAAALHTLDGKAADLADLIGKQPVLMEFWAVWCPSCKELEPTMIAMHAKYGSKVTFVGVAVSVNQSPALVQKYVDKYKLPGIQFYDTRGKATGAYDVAATSFVVLVDKTGKVVYTGSGGKQDLEAALKKVM